MTMAFSPSGDQIGVTELFVPQTTVKDLRSKEKNGYAALRLEIADGKKTLIREVRSEDSVAIGTEIKFEEILKPGDIVSVSGISKGKGFAGVVKRHNFKGGPRTHGQSDRERAPGSSGSTTTPGRVFKGTRRAGHMGNVRVMMRGLKVHEVDAANHRIFLIGSIPGFSRKGSLLTIRKSK